MTTMTDKTGVSMAARPMGKATKGAAPEVVYRARPKIGPPAKAGRDSKLERLFNYLASVCDHKFTGYIKINYSQGSLGRIERFEEILKK